MKEFSSNSNFDDGGDDNDAASAAGHDVSTCSIEDDEELSEETNVVSGKSKRKVTDGQTNVKRPRKMADLDGIQLDGLTAGRTAGRTVGRNKETTSEKKKKKKKKSA